MLGKGQPTLRGDRQLSYRQTSYILAEQPEFAVKTPIMVEAILQLYKEEGFEQLHIFGTRDSLWPTIYGHCVSDHLTDENFAFFESIQQKILAKEAPAEEEMHKISEAVGSYLQIPTSCKLIPVGKSEAEMWDIFREIIAIPQDGDRVSIDITHGVRFQPFILLMAMAYFRAVRKRVKWGKVFYGAYELSQDYFQGLSPIFDLTSLFSMFDWLAAATAFKEYGDLSPINQLLGASLPRAEAEQFLAEGARFTQAIQLYETHHIRLYAKRFLTYLNKLDTQPHQAAIPFHLIRAALTAFPEKLQQTQTESEMMLLLAQRHLQNEGQIGLGILAIWEAIIARFADIFGVDSRRIENYLELSKIVRGKKTWPSALLPPRLQGFSMKVQRINSMRNSIAHTQSEDLVSDQPIITEVWELYAYFRASLPEEDLEILHALIRFEPEELY